MSFLKPQVGWGCQKALGSAVEAFFRNKTKKKTKGYLSSTRRAHVSSRLQEAILASVVWPLAHC